VHNFVTSCNVTTRFLPHVYTFRHVTVCVAALGRCQVSKSNLLLLLHRAYLASSPFAHWRRRARAGKTGTWLVRTFLVHEDDCTTYSICLADQRPNQTLAGPRTMSSSKILQQLDRKPGKRSSRIRSPPEFNRYQIWRGKPQYPGCKSRLIISLSSTDSLRHLSHSVMTVLHVLRLTTPSSVYCCMPSLFDAVPPLLNGGVPTLHPLAVADKACVAFHKAHHVWPSRFRRHAAREDIAATDYLTPYLFVWYDRRHVTLFPVNLLLRILLHQQYRSCTMTLNCAEGCNDQPLLNRDSRLPTAMTSVCAVKP
jgi:hypothetical protein